MNYTKYGNKSAFKFEVMRIRLTFFPEISSFFLFFFAESPHLSTSEIFLFTIFLEKRLRTIDEFSYYFRSKNEDIVCITSHRNGNERRRDFDISKAANWYLMSHVIEIHSNAL